MTDINKTMVVPVITAYKCPNCGNTFSPAPRCPECGQRVVTKENHAYDIQERVKMLRAMETVCRNLNDEEVFMSWIEEGVADGDINENTTDSELVDEYCEDEQTFAYVMDAFLKCMKGAYESGGLFCGNVVSNIGEEKE